MKKALLTQYKIIFSKSDKCKILSLILANSLTYIKIEDTDNKNFSIIIKNKEKQLYERLLTLNKIESNFVEIKGKLGQIASLKTRPGIIVGFVFLIIALIFSSRVVWEINIKGNKSVSNNEILAELERVGLCEGTYIPNIDYDELHNKILLNSKSLAWVSVNIKGNIANVYVKEKKNEETSKEPTYTNVVAKSDGYIEEIRVLNGKKIVSTGQVVKKGDILISGVINSQSQGIRYEQAKGEVMAYVNKEIKIEIPYKSTKKEYTGKKYTEKDYKIYNFYINFSSKYGNQEVFYDKIEKRDKISVFGIKKIPFEIITTSLYEYKNIPVVLSKQEATDMAFIELREEMDKALLNAELISKEVKTSFDEKGFYIYCNLYCLENIAKTQEFYVDK